MGILGSASNGRGPRPGSNGRGVVSGADPATDAIVTSDWGRVAEHLGGLAAPAERLKAFPDIPGSDDEPWDVLLSMLGLDEVTGLQRLSERTGLTLIEEPRLDESASKFFEEIPPSLSRERLIAGLSSDGHSMTIATAQPMQPALFSLLEDKLDMPVRLVLSPRGAVVNLINRGYERRQDLVTEIVEEMPLDERAFETAAGSIRGSTDLLSLARQTPVIRLVNMILFEALRRRASDIHIHPTETKLVIRNRIDGLLIDAFSPPLALAAAIISRLKVMTDLDIANRHSPQDGHSTVRIGARKIDIRLSVLPTVYGERAVMRLLDQTQTQLSLDEVGMTKEMQSSFLSLLNHSNGLILVTGPTGSGKTTSLYGALEKVDRNTRNVMTIEDPVEYHLDGISQTQVNTKRGVTFASGLRALLRQDPDVILVGEIRDKETAELAIQASLTGHLVLATLHTNDAPSAIPRLVDMGAEPYLVTSTLLAVLAQRLLRRTYTPDPLDPTAPDPSNGSGYFGRIAVYELLKMNDELRRLTVQGADAVSIREAAEDAGFHPMIQDAKHKVGLGLTDQAEILRVLA